MIVVYDFWGDVRYIGKKRVEFIWGECRLYVGVEEEEEEEYHWDLL